MTGEDDPADRVRLRAALESAGADEAQHAQSYALAILRRLLAGALCARCGDPLGDGECGSDEHDRTMHEQCLSKAADEGEDDLAQEVADLQSDCRGDREPRRLGEWGESDEQEDKGHERKNAEAHSGDECSKRNSENESEHHE